MTGTPDLADMIVRTMIDGFLATIFLLRRRRLIRQAPRPRGRLRLRFRPPPDVESPRMWVAVNIVLLLLVIGFGCATALDLFRFALGRWQ